ncbi:uncharacterized protein LOC120350716 [Nilaparvata lugens]|uniref:uncharacterized protein LOC120350716 n=1 Tax=Nilaparvata lugens TaxID=108931 RepID=UPI00193E8848|nr:uncharacterized protein LOC120350716 [Nilaparvata lugens]
MAFKGKWPVRTKIVVGDLILEQVSAFTYLGCTLTYEKDEDIFNKLKKIQYICGTIHRTLKNKVKRVTKLKFYKTMAIPVLMYESESWVVGRKEISRIQAAEMRFLRSVKGCTRLDLLRNEDIREELKVEPLNEEIKKYRNRWKAHIDRMPTGRIPVKALNYRPAGKRDVGRPRKRWS